MVVRSLEKQEANPLFAAAGKVLSVTSQRAGLPREATDELFFILKNVPEAHYCATTLIKPTLQNGRPQYKDTCEAPLWRVSSILHKQCNQSLFENAAQQWGVDILLYVMGNTKSPNGATT